MKRAARGGQLELDLPTWGGRRKGAGRPPKGSKPGAPHVRRTELSGRDPLHVTVRVADEIWNLRTRRAFAALVEPLAISTDRHGMRVTHFSVQGNHLHLLVEAEEKVALARGMQGLLVRIARAVNRSPARA